MLNVGDRVRFKSWSVMYTEFGSAFDGLCCNPINTPIPFIPDMKHLCGTFATVSRVYNDDNCRIELIDFTATDDTSWNYCEQMVEKVDFKPVFTIAPDMLDIPYVSCCSAPIFTTSTINTSWTESLNIIENKKENYMELLEVYRDNARNKIVEEKQKKMEKIKKQDKKYVKMLEIEKLIEDEKLDDICALDYDRYDISIFEKSIQKELEKVDREFHDNEYKLNRTISEIKAQLDLCETYEQKQKILIAYGVIDEKTLKVK